MNTKKIKEWVLFVLKAPISIPILFIGWLFGVTLKFK